MSGYTVYMVQRCVAPVNPKGNKMYYTVYVWCTVRPTEEQVSLHMHLSEADALRIARKYRRQGCGVVMVRSI